MLTGGLQCCGLEGDSGVDFQTNSKLKYTVNSVYIKAVFVYKVGYQSVITIPGSARSQSCDS